VEREWAKEARVSDSCACWEGYRRTVPFFWTLICDLPRYSIGGKGGDDDYGKGGMGKGGKGE
jgi:hypothetical protein